MTMMKKVMKVPMSSLMPLHVVIKLHLIKQFRTENITNLVVCVIAILV